MLKDLQNFLVVISFLVTGPHSPLFVARKIKLYPVSRLRSVIVYDVVFPSMLRVMVPYVRTYLLMGNPPVFKGGFHVRVTAVQVAVPLSSRTSLGFPDIRIKTIHTVY